MFYVNKYIFNIYMTYIGLVNFTLIRSIYINMYYITSVLYKWTDKVKWISNVNIIVIGHHRHLLGASPFQQANLIAVAFDGFSMGLDLQDKQFH